MDADVVVLASGHGIAWHLDGGFLPDSRVRVRYTCPVRDPEGSLVPMPWKPGGLVRLAQDMGRPDLAQEIRRAQSEASSR